jgi:hypothetical protein
MDALRKMLLVAVRLLSGLWNHEEMIVLHLLFVVLHLLFVDVH